MWAELQPHDDPNGGGVVVRQFREDDPILRRALHPRADVGYQRARSPHAVVRALERTECAFHVGPFITARSIARGAQASNMTANTPAVRIRTHALRDVTERVSGLA